MREEEIVREADDDVQAFKAYDRLAVSIAPHRDGSLKDGPEQTQLPSGMTPTKQGLGSLSGAKGQALGD